MSNQKSENSSSYKMLADKIGYLPEPTYHFSVGDRVSVGSLYQAVVDSVLENGKIYRISYQSEVKKFGEVTYVESSNYFDWLSVRPVEPVTSHGILENDTVRISYRQMRMDGLLGRKYGFGVDFDPPYQRDYVWQLEDKQNLIFSVFGNIDIGKFLFQSFEWKEHPENMACVS